MFLRLTRGESAPLPTVDEAKAYPYTPQERAIADGMRRQAIIGEQDTVAKRLHALAPDTGADGLILTMNVADPALRLRTLGLVMDAVRAADWQTALVG